MALRNTGAFDDFLSHRLIPWKRPPPSRHGDVTAVRRRGVFCGDVCSSRQAGRAAVGTRRGGENGVAFLMVPDGTGGLCLRPAFQFAFPPRWEPAGTTENSRKGQARGTCKNVAFGRPRNIENRRPISAIIRDALAAAAEQIFARKCEASERKVEIRTKIDRQVNCRGRDEDDFHEIERAAVQGGASEMATSAASRRSPAGRGEDGGADTERRPSIAAYMFSQVFYKRTKKIDWFTQRSNKRVSQALTLL